MEILVALIAALAFILVGIPIGYVLIAASVLAIWLTTNTPLVVVPLRLFNGTDSFPLVAIPLFILAGALMNHAGISRRLTDFAASVVGWMRGGLAMTTTASSMLFSEMSGSAVADAAALGSVLIPAMKERGYPAPFAAAVLSASATIAILIPPSIPMILFGAVTGASIARLFLAGFVPGVLAGAFIMLVSRWLARRGGFGDSEPFRLRRAGAAARAAAWPLLIPAIILGGIFLGWFTATEAAAVAVLLALLMGVVGYRTVRFAAIREAFTESARQTAVVMLLVAGSAILGWYLANQQAPERLTAWVLSLADAPWAVALILNGVLLLAGTIPPQRRRHRPPRTDPAAAGRVRRDRNRALRHDGHREPRGGPADTPGGLGAHHHLLHRQDRDLGGDEGQRVLHRGTAGGARDRHVLAGGEPLPAGPGAG